LKIFNATELNKKPAEIFREADINGEAKINHDRYPDKVFILSGRARRQPVESLADKQKRVNEINAAGKKEC
jgi:hypothetical protein